MNDISEDDAKAELQKLEEKGHLFIQVDDNGKIKMQIRNYRLYKWYNR